MTDLCSKCGKNPVLIKKRALCRKCYAHERVRGFQAGIPLRPHASFSSKADTPTNENEQHFVNNFFRHDDWVHHPCAFRIGNMTYTPDFYDKRRNVFIEVVGTRQAFHFNKHKYAAFIQEFPLINFEVRRITGLKIELGVRQVWPQQETDMRKYFQPAESAETK